jgi:hypothetical protein
MHDRIIGALETCCRQGEMLHPEPPRRVAAAPDRYPGANAKDAKNRRIPLAPGRTSIREVQSVTLHGYQARADTSTASLARDLQPTPHGFDDRAQRHGLPEHAGGVKLFRRGIRQGELVS